LGAGLQMRGHVVTIATSSAHRARVEAAGLMWRRMRPEMPDDPGLEAGFMDPRTGSEILFRRVVAPAVADSYADLQEATRAADLLVSTPLSIVAPLLAETTGLPWISALLQPMGFFSAHDFPILSAAPRLTAALHPLGHLVGKPMRRAAREAAGPWSEPVLVLRRTLGLPVPGPDPLFEGQHSPTLVLAMFSRLLADPQPDWPPNVHVTGPLFWDETEAMGQPLPDLDRFLAAGPPPIVFTLGSAAVNAAGRFYADSLAAAVALGRRALFLVGAVPSNLAQLPNPLPKAMLALTYVPHARAFAASEAVVHQGGSGTLAQALRAGRPMLVVPFGHDQPDNAARAKRLGVGRVVPAARYTTAAAVHALRHLLMNAGTAERAVAVGREVRAEDGVGRACSLIEAILQGDRHQSQINLRGPGRSPGA
jgi:UDP:flavonoid glycosyltransferase YjiC (YdhE family)